MNGKYKWATVRLLLKEKEGVVPICPSAGQETRLLSQDDEFQPAVSCQRQRGVSVCSIPIGGPPVSFGFVGSQSEKTETPPVV